MNVARRPVIGIVARALRVEGRARRFLGAFESYPEAVSATGAEPVLLPLGASTEVLRVCDAVVLAGGEDPAVRRWWTGEGPSGDLDPARDDFETAVVEDCRRQRVPLLALCRGAQLVNGVRGGTLTRSPPHVLEDHGGTQEAFHAVRLRPGSRVATAFGGISQIEVLSRHAVYIATLGDELQPAGWAADGTIEAFEATDWPCIGAVWHAEWAGRAREPDLSLFRWLASAAGGRGT